jgi:hypothetical protein
MTLKRELQNIYEFMEEKGRLLLPYNPSLEVTSIDMTVSVLMTMMMMMMMTTTTKTTTTMILVVEMTVTSMNIYKTMMKTV